MNKKKYKVGYTQGVYDMFHVGHLNILNQAKLLCDYLIVGINSDQLVYSYKNKMPIINQEDRIKIVSNIKCVDECCLVDTLDKKEILKNYELSFDVIFIGDDWKGDPRWEKTTKEMAEYDIDVVFLPYTPDISSTILRPLSKKRIKE